MFYCLIHGIDVHLSLLFKNRVSIKDQLSMFVNIHNWAKHLIVQSGFLRLVMIICLDVHCCRLFVVVDQSTTVYIIMMKSFAFWNIYDEWFSLICSKVSKTVQEKSSTSPNYHTLISPHSSEPHSERIRPKLANIWDEM